MSGAWSQVHGTDLVALLFHVACFAGYRAWQRARALRDPSATLQGQQALLRAEWAAELLRSGNAILGVQTVRNAMMAAIFFASNAVFLVIAALTLSAQGSAAQTWGLLDPSGVRAPELVQAKVLLLLLTLLVAFFSFIGAIRLFAHASVTVGVKNATASQLASQIDAAWRYQGFGVRCYYFATPILFWQFGTPWLVIADLGALVLMHAFDSTPARS
jgi:uncharacterized membrane protein